MKNQKEFDELAMKVDSLMSIQQNLVREFKDNYVNLSPKLITSIKNLSAELKVVQDRLSKVKIDEGLPEPSSGFTPKIDSELKVTPTTVEEVNCRSTPKIDFTDINGAGATNSVKDYKVFNDEFRQFGRWKFIGENNINQFSYYFLSFIILYFCTHLTQITSVRRVPISAKYNRVTFDRGKIFATWDSLLRSLESLDAYCSDSYQFHIYIWIMDCLLVHMCASTGECLCCILSASGRVLDRGRLLELDRRYSILLDKSIRYFMEQRRYSYYIRNSSNLSLSILTCGLIVLHVVVSMQNYYANSVHNMILQPGYGLKLLFAKLNISFFVEDGDSGDTRKLFVIISKQGVFQWAESVLQMSRETENGLPQELFEQFLARNVIFPTQMEEVQKGLIASISNAIQHLLNCTSMNVYELFHRVESSDSVGATGVSERSHEPIDQIHPCRIWSFSGHTGFLNLWLGCELLFLLKTLHEKSVMIYVEASKPNDQSHILSKRVTGIFLVPIFIHQSKYFHGKGIPLFLDFQGMNYCFRMCDSGKEFQLKGRYTCLVRVNFYHDIRGCVFTEESIISDSSKLYKFFKQCDILWAILIPQQVYSSTSIWSSHLIIMFKLQDGIQGLQVCFYIMILLVVESDGKLLRKSMQAITGPGLLFLKTLEVAGIFVCLKRGYRGGGCSERRMETKEILNQASARKISRLGGLEEKLKEVMLGIFIEAEDAAQLFSITLIGSLTIAMRTIYGEDFIIRLQLKDWLINNRGAPCAGSVHVKKLETISILNYFVRGILSLVSSRQCFHCHNRVFFWTGICEWRVEIIHSRSIDANGIVCSDDEWYDLAEIVGSFQVLVGSSYYSL